MATGRSSTPAVDHHRRPLRNRMSSLAPWLCLFCLTVPGPPYPQIPTLAGGIRYTHELLNRNTHLLRLSAEYLPFDSEDSGLRRMSAFAQDFASKTCPGRYELDQRRTPPVAVRHPLGQNFVFRCR